MFEANVRPRHVEISLRHVTAYVLRDVADLLDLPALGDVAKGRSHPRDFVVAWEPELDEPLAVEGTRHRFQNLDAPLIVLDQLVVGPRACLRCGAAREAGVREELAVSERLPC